MTDYLVERSAGDGVIVVKLDRPPANALTPDFLLEIEARFTGFEQDDATRAVVLTGRDNVLSAGMDLNLMPDLDIDGQRRVVDALNRAFGRLYGFAKPLVAVVNGHAIAGGLFFALAADYRVAARNGGKFGLTEVRIGLPFPMAALEIARAELSPQAFRRLLLRGRTIDADAALELGIFDELTDADTDIETAAIAVARSWAESPAEGYARVKRQMRDATLDKIRRAVEDGDDPTLDGWFTDAAPAAIRNVLGR